MSWPTAIVLIVVIIAIAEVLTASLAFQNRERKDDALRKYMTYEPKRDTRN